MRPYFTITGCEKDGWTLMVYDQVVDSAGRETGSVSTRWRKAKEFATLRELLEELMQHEEIA